MLHENIGFLGIRGVIDDDHGEIADPGPPRRLQFAQHHVEAAVAGHRDDRLVGGSQRGAHPARQPIADRGEAAVGDVMPAGRLGYSPIMSSQFCSGPRSAPISTAGGSAPWWL